MTKREFLESIGYEYCSYSECYEKNSEYFEKDIVIGNYEFLLYQVIEIENNKFLVSVQHCIRSQKDIDNLQIAFNNVKRDFKEMQKYED